MAPAVALAGRAGTTLKRGAQGRHDLVVDPSWDESPFRERFELRQRLGEGGFGVVYHAFDRERGCDVALKTLKKIDADALYRLKREFRSLADISHPSLVTLHELLSERDQWAISMELIEDGENLVHYVRGRDGAPDSMSSAPTIDNTFPELGPLSSGGSEEETIVRPSGSGGTASDVDLDRLRTALRGVTAGLIALHDAGRLHRDIKPSNVLVTPEGRVVILDFGLVTERAKDGKAETLHLVGTPYYMSPEQARGAGVDEATDWYALGVMLFEALVGRPPFVGTASVVAMAKQRSEAPQPSSFVDDVPQDIDHLCRDLLQPRPEDRPSGREVLRRLGGEPTAPAIGLPGSELPFVGREQQLRALRKAYRSMERGEASIAFVGGKSGMGKTALVEHFLERIQHRHRNTVVLTGRCYERESVPYKALDSLVDSLSRQLARMKRSEIDALLPRDVTTLARLFPVLGSLRAISDSKRRMVEISDSRELRRRAFRALREMLARLAERNPVVLFIDDLHWGDVDSASLLGELLRPPDEPALLLICTYRAEDVDSSEALRTLLRLRSGEGVEAKIFDVSVDPFSAEESSDLAHRLLERLSPELVTRADELADEAAGSPYFLEQLVSATGAGQQVDRPREHGDVTATLDAMLGRQIAALPDEGQRLLEMAAVVGRPAPLAAVAAAAGIDGDVLTVLSPLRAARLVRTRTGPTGEEVETYHDRIRVTVGAGISEQRLRECHRLLFEVFSRSADVDVEALAMHAHGAGDVERAAFYAAEAAGRAAEALAFDHAARLYRVALELGPQREPEELRQLRLRLAEALGNAGRGARAAEALLAAAEGAAPDEALELRRQAAQHYLMSGHLKEGLATVEQVLAAQGMALPKSPRHALLSILWRRLWLRVRGLGYRERSEDELSVAERMKVDTCWTVGGVLFLSSTGYALDFQNRGLLLALKAGEPNRVARSLSMELVQCGLGGSRSIARTEKIIRAATAAAKRANRPVITGMATLYTGCARALNGEWSKAVELADRAKNIFRESCTGVAWELDNCYVFSMFALQQQGELREMAERFGPMLHDAEERGDLFLATYLQTDVAPRVHLAEDDPERAHEVVQQGIARWPYPGFSRQHQYALRARVDTHLYSGDGPAALRLIEEQYPRLKRSFLLRAQMNNIMFLDYRGRALLMAAQCESDGARREERWRAAEQDARGILKEKNGWGEPLAQLLMASIAAARGSRDDAIDVLTSAEAGFETADMRAHLAVASARRGALIGGERGRELIAEAESWLTGQGIRRPEHWKRMLAPGDWT
jgi:serine/threonine protein kinase/tetratricopeptide (TPR) repeat protein